MKFDFLFQRRSNSHKYRIHQSPRTFPKFTSLSACHPFENSLDYPLARQWKLVTRRGAFHPVVERWIAFVVDERKKDKREREKAFESVLCGGGELERQASDKGSVVCMYNTLLPANRLRFARSSRHAGRHSNNCASGCLHADTGRHWNLHGAERLSENRLFRETGRNFMGESDDRLPSKC